MGGSSGAGDREVVTCRLGSETGRDWLRFVSAFSDEARRAAGAPPPRLIPDLTTEVAEPCAMA